MRGGAVIEPGAASRVEVDAWRCPACAIDEGGRMTMGFQPTDQFVARAREIANAFLDKAEEGGKVTDPRLRSAVNAGDLTFEQQVRNEVQGVQIFAAGVAVAWAPRLDFPPDVWIDDAG